MKERILNPRKFPVPRIPVFSGGASGERYSIEHDPAYGNVYYAPFGVATKKNTGGEEYLRENDIDVHVLERPEGMTHLEWSNRLVDLIDRALPSQYRMEDVLLLLTGCDNIARGKKMKGALGNRKMNVHPAPLYILIDEKTGHEVNVDGLMPEQVKNCYLQRGYVRKYTGWGEDIMRRIVDELNFGASTSHLATIPIDHGPCIAVKRKNVEDRHRDDPELFQSELKEECDGPAIVAATHMLIRDLGLEGESLYIGEYQLPYQGFNLHEDWESDLEICRMRH